MGEDHIEGCARSDCVGHYVTVVSDPLALVLGEDMIVSREGGTLTSNPEMAFRLAMLFRGRQVFWRRLLLLCMLRSRVDRVVCLYLPI